MKYKPKIISIVLDQSSLPFYTAFNANWYETSFDDPLGWNHLAANAKTSGEFYFSALKILCYDPKIKFSDEEFGIIKKISSLISSVNIKSRSFDVLKDAPELNDPKAARVKSKLEKIYSTGPFPELLAPSNNVDFRNNQIQVISFKNILNDKYISSFPVFNAVEENLRSENLQVLINIRAFSILSFLNLLSENLSTEEKTILVIEDLDKLAGDNIYFWSEFNATIDRLFKLNIVIITTIDPVNLIKSIKSEDATMFFEKYTQKIFMPYDAIDTETEKLLPLNNVQMSVLKKVNPKTRLFLLTNQLHDDIYLELSLGGIYDSFKYLSATPEHLTEWQLIYEETGKNTEAWVKLLMI